VARGAEACARALAQGSAMEEEGQRSKAQRLTGVAKAQRSADDFVSTRCRPASCRKLINQDGDYGI
jgi:hypothetical protein